MEEMKPNPLKSNYVEGKLCSLGAQAKSSKLEYDLFKRNYANHPNTNLAIEKLSTVLLKA